MSAERSVPAPEPLPFALLRKAAEFRAEKGFFLSPSGPLHFFLRGPRDAPPLLILHGMGDLGPGWMQAIGPLSRRFRVHALDLPGHGLSAMPPDFRLSTLLSAVRAYAQTLTRPLVVGHSLGGWLGARLALEGLVPLAGLVLVNPAGAALPAEEWAGFQRVVEARDAKGARAYLKAAFHRPPPLLWLFPGEVLKVMQSPTAQGLLGSLQPEDFLEARELSRLSLPMRLIWGSDDHFLPLGTLSHFRDHLRGVDVVTLERAGHCPHLEAPRRLAEAILRPFE